MDWRAKHHAHVLAWENRQRTDPDFGEDHDPADYQLYLQWLHRSVRVHIYHAYTDEPIEEESDDDDVVDEYDVATRVTTQPQRATKEIYVVKSCISMSVLATNFNQTLLTLFVQADQLTRYSNEAAELLNAHRHEPPGHWSQFVKVECITHLLCFMIHWITNHAH